MTLHAQIIEKDGKKEFAVLPYEEFLKVREILEDYEDLQDLRAAKTESGDSKSYSVEEAARELGI